MVEVVAEGVPGRGVVTKEPTPPEVIPEVQDVQCATLGEKVWAELPRNVINLDYDQEEYSKEEEILKPTEELSILRIELRKWRIQVERYQEGMLLHKNQHPHK